MELEVTLIIILGLMILVWLFWEAKTFKHRLWAFLTISFLMFLYISFAATLDGQNIDYTTMRGLKQAGGIYFEWLKTIFNNAKSVTMHAIRLNWRVNN